VTLIITELDFGVLLCKKQVFIFQNTHDCEKYHQVTGQGCGDRNQKAQFLGSNVKYRQSSGKENHERFNPNCKRYAQKV
jgi:hypothetical protein